MMKKLKKSNCNEIPEVENIILNENEEDFYNLEVPFGEEFIDLDYEF